MSNPIIVLAEHAAETLPDSMAKRKEVLTAILKCLTPKHRAWPNVRAQLAAIEAAEKLQSELPLLFTPGLLPPKPSNQQDGE